MPSKTFIIRAHARTIHTRPVTFVCAKCEQMTTRDCYPGTPPKYCLECAPKKKKHDDQRPPERSMFKATHNLIAQNGKKTPVCLVPLKKPGQQKGWFEVRTALDWFSGESIIQYHEKQGLHSKGVPLSNYKLEPVANEH